MAIVGQSKSDMIWCDTNAQKTTWSLVTLVKGFSMSLMFLLKGESLMTYSSIWGIHIFLGILRRKRVLLLSSAQFFDGLFDDFRQHKSIHHNVNPGFFKIPNKSQNTIASIASLNLEVTSHRESWVLFTIPKTLGQTPRPAPRYGGGTAQSSAELDESTQGSAHGNLGRYQDEPRQQALGRRQKYGKSIEKWWLNGILWDLPSGNLS